MATHAEAGDILCLFGDLGAGKTQLAKGVGLGLGVVETVNSRASCSCPSTRVASPLFHVDLYRLADGIDALGSGLLDERQSDGVTLIEWAERLGSSLPGSRLDISIDGSGDEPRTVTLWPADARHDRYLEALR